MFSAIKFKALIPVVTRQLVASSQITTTSLLLPSRSYVSARTPQTESHTISSFGDLSKKIKKTLEGDPGPSVGDYAPQDASQNKGSKTEQTDFYKEGFSGTARLMVGRITKVEGERAYVDIGKKYPAVFDIHPTQTSGSQLKAGSKVSVRVSDESFANDTTDRETEVQFDHLIEDKNEQAIKDSRARKTGSYSQRSYSTSASKSNSGNRSSINSDTGINDNDPVGNKSSTGASGLNTNRGSDSSKESTSVQGSSSSSSSSSSKQQNKSDSGSDATLADDIKRERPMSGKSNMPAGDKSIPAHMPGADPKHSESGKKGSKDKDPAIPVPNYDSV